MECPSLSESGSAGVLSTNSAQKRPMNAFLIFCKRHRSVVRERYPHLENRAITRILGEWWASLSSEDKRDYTELAKKYKEHFMLMNPNFKWYKTAELNRPPQSNSPPPPVPNAETQPLIDDVIDSQVKPSSPSSGSSITNENTLADGTARESNCAPKPLKKRYLENGEFKAGCTQNIKLNVSVTVTSQQARVTESSTESSAGQGKSSSLSSKNSDEISTAGPPILDLETANRVIENALSGAVQNALQGLNNDFNSELISHRVNSVRELIDATNNQNGPSLDLSRSANSSAQLVKPAGPAMDSKLKEPKDSDTESDSSSSTSERDSVPKFTQANKTSSGTATPANASDGEARLSARNSPGVSDKSVAHESFHVEAKPLAQSPPPPYAVVKGPSIFANSTSSILETVASFARKVDKTPSAVSGHDNDPDKPLNLSASKVLTASNQHIIDHFIDKLLTASNTEAGNPMPKELTSLSSPSSPPIESASPSASLSSSKLQHSSSNGRSAEDHDTSKKSDGGKKSERTCKGKRYAELVRDGKLGKPKSTTQTDSDQEGRNNCENQSKWVTGGFDLEKHIAQLPQLGDAQLLDALSNSKSVTSRTLTNNKPVACDAENDRDKWQRGSTSSTAQLASDYLHDTIVNEIKRKPSESPKATTMNPPPVTSAGIVTAAEVVERVRAAQAAAAAKQGSSSPGHQTDLKRGHQSHQSFNGDKKRLRFSSDEDEGLAAGGVDSEANRSASNPLSPRSGTQLNQEPGTSNMNCSNGSEPIECDGLAALAEVALLQARNSLAS